MDNSIFSSQRLLKLDKNSSYTGYVSISKPGEKTLIFSVPITGIRIDNNVDYAMNKTLGGNFNVLVFLLHPVAITLQGMLCVTVVLCNKNSASQVASAVRTFYDTYKLNKNSKDPVQITIANTVYLAFIVFMRQLNDLKVPGILNYTMLLYGTKKG